MAEFRLPRYTRAKKTRGGPAFFWELPHWARSGERNGAKCPIVSTALGTDIGLAIKRADQLNDALDGWRTSMPHIDTTIGTVAWLFGWYRKQRRFTKLAAKTQSDYKKIMNAVAGLQMRVGTFGQRLASKVETDTADKVYEKFESRGERQALYVVQVCRLVWTWAGRYPKLTGIAKDQNPFAGMKISYSVEVGNRAATRDEYERYCETARTLGFQSMATAAALCFECVQRVWDCFGFPDPEIAVDGTKTVKKRKSRGIKWEGYRPAVSIALVQSKTRKSLTIPLVDHLINGERIALYPELEAQLALSRAATAEAKGLIVVEERNQKPYSHRRMSTVHRLICNAAGLPNDLTFTSFRHGGITEIGDSGEADVRAISGHKKLDTTAIYNKANAEKAVRIALRRREHLQEIDARVVKKSE